MITQETQDALDKQALCQRVMELEEHTKQQEARIDSLVSDREKALRWGVTTLGAAVMVMGAWILNFILGHLK